MDIVSIFGKNLFSIKYPGESKDEFNRIFNSWQDAEYLEEFFENNKEDINNGFWNNISVEDAILETYQCARELESKLIELSKKSEQEQLLGLDSIFKLLHDSQSQIFTLDRSKAKLTWLRIYALRVDKNTFIVTGGAIKLTQKMQDREHTNKELQNLETCRNFLIEQGIVDVEGIIEEFEI